jgi:carbapenam-3-carboxylate synthase
MVEVLRGNPERELPPTCCVSAVSETSRKNKTARASSSILGRFLAGKIDIGKEPQFTTQVELPVGFTAFCRALGDGILLGYGDRLTSAAELPASPGLDQIISWCVTQFSRYALVVFRGDYVALITDPMGTFPLFFSIDAGRLAFPNRAVDLLLNDLARSLADFGGQRPIPPLGKTVFSGVRSVPPGTVLVMRPVDAAWSITWDRAYYKLPDQPRLKNAEHAARAIYSALERAVAFTITGAKEVCVSLSGGVDSTSVACLARLAGAKLRTFTIGSTYGNEFREARATARALQAEHTELTITVEDLRQLLPHLIETYETWDPLTLQIATPTAFLYERLKRAGRRHLFLTGYGSDLIFAGTLGPYATSEELEGAIRRQILLTVPTNEMSPNLAAQCDVTVRYPFWHTEVLQIGMETDVKLKVYNGIEKWVLRKAMEPVLPSEVTWRTKLGIHEGARIDQLFADLLGTRQLSEQATMLRTMALEEFAKVRDRRVDAPLT